MANVTDPLARSVHGTNPQNLVEYITRQKIYDSHYWKEECFGLSASDIATKASELKAVGGSYGGNCKPTRFLCLCLKMLQIQPEEGIVEEFLENEEFKYVRALGAFYLRLTGRPAEIYEGIEPLFRDFRKLRFRTPTDWKISRADEFADELLTSDRCCGIALPHLPKREVLVRAGYLDGPRRSALGPLIEERAGGDVEKFLRRSAEEGNEAAKRAWEERKRSRKGEDEGGEEGEGGGPEAQEGGANSRATGEGDDRRGGGGGGGDRASRPPDDGDGGGDEERRRRRKKTSSEGGEEKKYGSLFKKKGGADGGGRGGGGGRKSRWDDAGPASAGGGEAGGEGGGGGGDDPASTEAFEGSAEYWNEQRAKLGLKPLRD
ncbi:hypothetical protein ACHAWF_004959 [Thalassiosira exigua]